MHYYARESDGSVICLAALCLPLNTAPSPRLCDPTFGVVVAVVAAAAGGEGGGGGGG
jgi:hypothetical protein